MNSATIARINNEAIARVAHEVNRAYCRAIGDDSQLPWGEAEDWQRESALTGVAVALQNPDATPELMHDSWMATKIADGWVYGETKDPVAKTHPCLVPYAQLPERQRVKDYLFLAVVRSLAEGIA